MMILTDYRGTGTVLHDMHGQDKLRRRHTYLLRLWLPDAGCRGAPQVPSQHNELVLMKFSFSHPPHAKTVTSSLERLREGCVLQLRVCDRLRMV
jgi:hypothetical protein